MQNPNLSDEERKVLFDGGTETPFSGALLHETRDGAYTCKNCGQELFRGDAKFDSGSGWPSFSEPANREHLVFKRDTSYGMVRTEVTCANCGAHLGHVFEDETHTTTGEYYCINSVCLDFHPEQAGKDAP